MGLKFDTTNSAQLAEALINWWSALLHGLRDFLKTLRTIASAGTIYAAFPGVMLLAAAYGYSLPDSGFAGGRSRYVLPHSLAAVLFTIRFAIPRTAFFAYPAIYLLAAAGLTHVAQATVSWRSRGALSAVVVMIGLLLLVTPSLVALVGYGEFDNNFHFWTPQWLFADEM